MEDSRPYSSLKDIKDEGEEVFEDLTDYELNTVIESLEFAFENPVTYRHN